MTHAEYRSKERKSGTTGLKLLRGTFYTSAIIGVGFSGLASLGLGTVAHGLARLLIEIGLVGSVLCLIAGWWCGRKVKKLAKEEFEYEMLQSILELGGRTTSVELATKSGRSRKECKAFLEEMNRDGDAEMQVMDGGNLVYVLPGIASDKSTAHDPSKRQEYDDILRAAEPDDRER